MRKKRQNRIKLLNNKVIAPSMLAEKTIVNEMSKAGAYGYIPKSCLFDEPDKTFKAVKKGEPYFPKSLL